jgi:TPR repeat protein
MLSADPIAGEQRLKALAEEGSPYSMVRLGHLHWKRALDTDDANLDRAEFWFLSAWRAGSKMATFYLGRLYLKKQEYAKACSMFESGAELGYAPSIFHLGRIYRDGIGVEKDHERARALFERSAGLGHIYAQRALGRLLLSGEFGFCNRAKGVRLVIRAAIDATRELQRDRRSERLQM